MTTFTYGLLSLISALQNIIWNLQFVGKRGEDKIIIIPEFLGVPKVDENERNSLSPIGMLKSSPDKIRE